MKQKDSYLNIICKRGIAIRKKVEKQPFLYRRSGISIHSWLRSPSDVEVSKSNQESAPHTEYPMEHRSCCIYNDGIPCYRTSILVYTNIVFNYCERLRDTDLSRNLSWWYEQLFVKRTDFSLGCCFVSILFREIILYRVYDSREHQSSSITTLESTTQWTLLYTALLWPLTLHLPTNSAHRDPLIITRNLHRSILCNRIVFSLT